MIVVFCGVCGKDKGQKKKQGRAVKSCTTLSCLENGVQKYRVVLIAFYFFQVWNCGFGNLEKKKNRIYLRLVDLFLYPVLSCLPLLEVSDPPTNQYL